MTGRTRIVNHKDTKSTKFWSDSDFGGPESFSVDSGVSSLCLCVLVVEALA